MELNTLRDLRIAIGAKEYLRQEAIKWIKELTPKKKGDKIIVIHGNFEKIDWIKHFFNIKEEDLKGG